jgi:hypothetical protein
VAAVSLQIPRARFLDFGANKPLSRPGCWPRLIATAFCPHCLAEVPSAGEPGEEQAGPGKDHIRRPGGQPGGR